MEKIIYDIGANHGGNLPYYLLKADKVVAVEANPVLAKKLESQFPDAVAAGKLIVVNCAVTGPKATPEVTFYVHKTNDVLSTFSKPKLAKLDHYEQIIVPSIRMVQLIKEYGDPYYIKIDVEGYDHVILKSLINNKIFPKYLSVEAHAPEVLPLLVVRSPYQAFQIVEGFLVGTIQKTQSITDKEGNCRSFKFNIHEAGPFGDDLKGTWRTSSYALREMGMKGCGWRDIHVSLAHQGVKKNFRLPIECLKILALSPVITPIVILSFCIHFLKERFQQSSEDV